LVFALGAAVAGLGVTLGAALPGHTKLDGMLRAGASGDVHVIVRARAGKRPAVRAHLQRHGAVLQDHQLINAVTATLPATSLADMDRDNAVESISLDVPMIDTASANPRSDAQTTPAVLDMTLGLPVQGITGRGVGVATIDSGLEPNGDFGAVAFYDFTPAAGHHPYDDYGHGTHVAGLIASSGALSRGPAGSRYPGMAPRARLISLKVLDAHGTAMTSTVIKAIEFAVANRRALGIDVINLSLGHPILEPAETDPLVQAVEAATRNGIVVVVAAGNVGRNIVTGVPGYAGILSPANAASAITVGALGTQNTLTHGDDAIPSYSSRGPTWYDARPKPDIVAPGQDLVSDAALGSTIVLEHPDHLVTVPGSKTRFLRMSGTSMAAAVTSGVAALVIDAIRRAGGTVASPRMVKDILAFTAVPLRGYDALTQGHGALNAAGAIALAKAIGASAPIAPYTVVTGETWSWSQATTFPASVVWDGRAIPAWAQTIVWGTSRDGDTIVWGTSRDGDTIVWGTSRDGDTIVWGTTIDWGNAALWAATSMRGAG
jgi:serine protease AprX